MVPTVELNNGVAMPQLGFGTWNVGQREVELALEAGYRSIDTATIYANEDGVGRAIAASGVPREEIFVTTKVWNDDQGYDSTLRAFEESRGRLGLEAVDLYLIHWPEPEQDLYVETWRALERLLEEGAVRAIGVSNFEVEHLERLARECDVVPAVDQVKLHPDLSQPHLREYGTEQGIAIEAWSPIARGGSVLAEPVMRELAERYGKTPAQIALRWEIELGLIVIPRSSNPDRIRENFDVFDFELTVDAVQRVTALDANTG